MTKILLLEDDRNLQEIVKELLEDQEYEVTAASNAAEACQFAQYHQYDLLLTDVRMAGAQDGIGALTQIKTRQPGIYSIIMTGFTDDAAPSRAMQAGADYFLYKPFEMARLLGAVEDVLSTRQIQETIQGQIKSFFNSASRFFGRKETQPQVELERPAFFKSLYAGIQSENLTKFAALSLWDDVQPLESRYEGLMQILGPDAEELAEAYRELNGRAQQMASQRTSANYPARLAGDISVAQLETLYQRVRTGRVSGPTLMTAPLLWQLARSPKKSASPQLSMLWNQLFGDDQQASQSKQMFNQLLKTLSP